MRIYRVDGVEITSVPEGIQISRDTKCTPIAPPGFPHKVEYLQTDTPNPAWILVCDNRRKYDQELAGLLHTKNCHYSHEDQCGWTYESWDNPGYSRREYLKRADAILRSLQNHSRGLSQEGAFALAEVVLKNM